MRLGKLFLFFLVLLGVSLPSSKAQLQRFHFVQEKMGSPFHLLFYHTDSSSAFAIGEKCFALVDSLNHIFSDYDFQSEVSNINRTAFTKTVSVSPQMQDLLCKSMQAYQLSNGIFDVGLGSITQIWRNARKIRELPSDSMLQEAKMQAGLKWVSFSCAGNTIGFLQPKLQLDFGGIAKGYVAQKVIERLQSWGIHSALADAGGDMVTTEAPPGKEGWQIAINRPEEKEALLEKKLWVKNKAVATSGDSFQLLEIDNLRYSHILDPHTGKGITNGKNVTIIAADGATADWLATACSILETDAALALAKKCGAELLITQVIGGKIAYAQTPGFWK